MKASYFDEGEFHAAVFPEPTWLVEPIIPAKGICILHGPKTAGKTQLALTLGVAVAHGVPFLGEYPCKQGKVLLIETDMPRKMLQMRVAQAEATKRIKYLHAEPFDIVSLMQRATLPEAFQRARDAEPMLVLVDSLRKTSSQDEIDSASPTRVFTSWQRLFPDAAIAIIHHDKKLPTQPGATYRMEEAARGSGAWLDDADTGIQLSKVRHHKAGGHISTLSFSKARYMEDPQPIQVRMVEPGLLLEPVVLSQRARLETWLAANRAASRQEAVEWLMRSGLSQASAYRLLQGKNFSQGSENSHARENANRMSQKSL